MRLPDKKSDKGETSVFLLDTEPATHERVFQTISRFTLAGDFNVEDLTLKSACISVQGAKAASKISTAFGFDTSDEGKRLHQLHWKGVELMLVHASHTGEDGYDIIVSETSAPSIWKHLESLGAKPVGANALEILRIEAGIARFGIDMDENLVVSETNLDDAVSFTKGCYVGQEIIARIKYRGHVAKKISGLVLNQQVESGARILSTDNKEIGAVSSVAFSRRLHKWIALGLIKYQYLPSGTEVVLGDERISAVVTELPFVKGSWQAHDHNG
jgi:folate-binding protein YgfZ